MRIHHEPLADVTRYLESFRDLRLEDKEGHFRSYLRVLEPYKRIDAGTRILEVGTGIGWFPLLCRQKGLTCKGLEISPRLIEYARQLGRRYGLEPDIELGNIEESDIGSELYDVIIASSVFEHIEHWQPALQRIYRALRPGGALFFESTNKFSPTSGEFRLPLYGWLPNRLRYWLRRRCQGDDIMKLGIDFHQFTYPQLRREFRRVGFAACYDLVELARPAAVRRAWKRWLVVAARRRRLVKVLALTLADVTRFVCVK
jgi:SAM-dependent methyltransferase